MLLIELNEFSVEFLKRSSALQATPTLDKILSWRCCKTNTEEKNERGGLDPWVQWVSIHTGLPAREHGIAHLAEADRLAHEQIWDQLNDRGFSTTVWGAMNAKNNQHGLMNTFVPDPWTTSEAAVPSELNGLLALPRLYAKDYVRPNLWSLGKSALRTGGYILTRQLGIVLRNLGVWTRPVLRAGLNNAILFALFDNLSAKLFREFCRQNPSDFKLIFLNSIAHLQHHNWQPDSHGVQAAIQLLENTLTSALEVAGEGEPVLVANAFSQVCTADDDEYLYRPVDPQRLIAEFRIRHSHVDQMMTNDGHIFFDDTESCDEAYAILAAATVDNKKAFDIDRRSDAQLFYQFKIWSDLPKNAVIRINGLSLKFYDMFKKVVRRTGSHTSTGEVFYINADLPEEIRNHDLFHHIEDMYV